MTWLQWFGGGLLVLCFTVTVLSWVGAHRWAALTRADTQRLDAGRLGMRGVAAGPTTSPTRFHAAELEGLPAPVQRYFRTVLREGQPIVDTARIEMIGTINLSANAEHWKPFTAQQHVVTQRPGFLWSARIGMFPGVPAWVQDSYIAGQGQLLVKLLGLFTVAQAQGEGELARGEFMRYLAEAAWYPTALLPSQGVHWQAVDDVSARATLVDGPISLTLLFRFGETGTMASVRAESRGAGVGKDMVMLPWDCRYADDQWHHGMLIPMTGEAAWVRPEGRRPYFVGHIQKLDYEFAP